MVKYTKTFFDCEAARASAEETGQLLETQSGAWVPADAMAFDKVVDPGDLRDELIAALTA